MTMWMRRLGVVLLAAGWLSACSSDPENEVQDTGVEDSSGQPDTDEDSGEDVGPEPGEPIAFVIRNESDATIYVQDNSHADYGLAWLEVTLNGEELELSSACLPCACDDPEPCGVCDAPLPSVIELAPGDEVSHTWDGVYYTVNASETPQCTETQQVGSASFSAELCYATALQADQDQGAFVSDEDTACQSFSAALGEEDVRLVVGAL